MLNLFRYQNYCTGRTVRTSSPLRLRLLLFKPRPPPFNGVLGQISVIIFPSTGEEREYTADGLFHVRCIIHGRHQPGRQLRLPSAIPHALRPAVRAREAVDIEGPRLQATPPRAPALLCGSNLRRDILLEALVNVGHEINIQAAVVQCPTVGGIARRPEEVLCPRPLWLALGTDPMRSKPAKSRRVFPGIFTEQAKIRSRGK
jgi:hypothetical protein